jgi:ribosomal protein L29
MHIFTYDSKGHPILEAAAVAESLCDATSSAKTNSDPAVSCVAPQGATAQSPGSDLDLPDSVMDKTDDRTKKREALEDELEDIELEQLFVKSEQRMSGLEQRKRRVRKELAQLDDVE